MFGLLLVLLAASVWCDDNSVSSNIGSKPTIPPPEGPFIPDEPSINIFDNMPEDCALGVCETVLGCDPPCENGQVCRFLDKVLQCVDQCSDKRNGFLIAEERANQIAFLSADGTSRSTAIFLPWGPRSLAVDCTRNPPFLFIGNNWHDQLWRVELSSPSTTNAASLMQLTGGLGGDVDSIALDPVNQLVLVGAFSTGVWRIHYSGSPAELMCQSQDPDDIIIPPGSSVAIWTDSNSGPNIHYVDTYLGPVLKTRLTLISNPGNQPHGLHLDAGEGRLYWCLHDGSIKFADLSAPWTSAGPVQTLIGPAGTFGHLAMELVCDTFYMTRFATPWQIEAITKTGVRSTFSVPFFDVPYGITDI